MKKILITGSTGFIGKKLVEKLNPKENIIIIAGRNFTKFGHIHRYCQINNIDGETDWSHALDEVDVVIHLAGRAHILNEVLDNPLQEFIQTNSEGTLNLANQAIKKKVKRFIYISSVGVNGTQKEINKPFKPDSIPNPERAYAISKLIAEIGLKSIAKNSVMDFVIIRPPLVYGPNAPGNFQKLMESIINGRYLPLGFINNKRSFVHIDNLVDLIITCIESKNAKNQILLVSDGKDLSTTELSKLLYKSLQLPSKLIPIPKFLLFILLKLIGKEPLAKSLCDSQQVDITKTCNLLDWKPIISIEDGVSQTAQYYLSQLRVTHDNP